VALEQGLVDLAWLRVEEARSLLPPRAGSEDTRAADFDRERIVLDHLEARVLTSMEDYGALESHVLAAVEDRVYAKYPGHDARLLALLGLGLKESARTKPSEKERSRECLLRALGEARFTGLDRVLPELALGEIALREGNRAGRRRKYYRLTEKGFSALEVEKRQWLDVHALLVKLWGPELAMG
jgi:hypothetical protein